MGCYRARLGNLCFCFATKDQIHRLIDGHVGRINPGTDPRVGRLEDIIQVARKRTRCTQSSTEPLDIGVQRRTCSGGSECDA
jgi:hypothetical protein